MHNTRTSKRLDRILIKLSKKDKKFFEQILRKIQEVKECFGIEHYKNLRYNMKDYKRVHIGHFVLVFSYDKKDDLISFEDLDHHDNIYKKKS